MPYRHLIRWLADGQTEWLSTSREGAVLQGPSPGLPAQPAEQLIVLLPAEDVLLLEAPRLARNPAQLAKALPFAIEESLAGPVESQHVAFADTGSADSVAVAVVAEARLSARLTQLRNAGLNPDAAYSELHCLPLYEGAPTLLVEQGRAMLRAGHSAGLVLAADQLEASREWLAGQGWDLARARGFCVDGGPGDLEPLQQPVLIWLATHLPGTTAPNLLQGRFAPPRRQAAANARWRWVAGLAVLAVVLGMSNLLLERRALEQHVQERQREMEQLLRQTLPDVQRVVDPVAQLRAALKGRGAGGADGLVLLGRIAPILSGGSQVTIDAIEYRGGTLELVVLTADVATLDSVRERLSSLALQVDLTAAVPGSRGVEGRLRIRGAGA